MNTHSYDTLFVADVDNTILKNWDGWDFLIRAVSKALYGIEFGMLKKPDGSKDRSFGKKTTSEIWRERLVQVGLDPDDEDEGLFYRTLDAQGSMMDFYGKAERFGGVITLLGSLRRVSIHPIRLLSTGMRGIQSKVIRDLNLTAQFDLAGSLFYGECASKADGLSKLSGHVRPRVLAYIGDAPSDMTALKQAASDAGRRIAVGVTVAGLSTAEELLHAGADYLIQSYDTATIRGLTSLVARSQSAIE